MFSRKAKPKAAKTYDSANWKPVLKCSICTGEQTAGFQEIHTGQFEDIMLVRGQKDLEEFVTTYGLDPAGITKIY
ncbi:MAG: aspartate dehydrogenase [Lachnospiraceae bacterium]|nr:aspartate dehydrogenase [Lachnospiraceae bacterium]